MLLQSMDGLQSAKKNKDSGVVIVGATNRVGQLPISVNSLPKPIYSPMIWTTRFFGDSRLATRMMVDLPNEGEREHTSSLFRYLVIFVKSTFPEILRLHLRDEQLGEGVDLQSIARQTHHYSGSDLKGELFHYYYQQSLNILHVSSLCIGRNGICQRCCRRLQLDSAHILQIQYHRRHI